MSVLSVLFHPLALLIGQQEAKGIWPVKTATIIPMVRDVTEPGKI